MAKFRNYVGIHYLQYCGGRAYLLFGESAQEKGVVEVLGWEAKDGISLRAFDCVV